MRPEARGRKRTAPLHGSHCLVPAKQRLHSTLNIKSFLPPVSSGQLQSRITEVSLMTEITFRGAEGGPNNNKNNKKSMHESKILEFKSLW